MPVYLCQHNPQLSRAESSSSTASFVCTRASESYRLLESLRAGVTHINETGQSEACQLVLFPLSSLCNADVAKRPLSARGSILHGQSRVEHVSSPLDRDERSG